MQATSCHWACCLSSTMVANGSSSSWSVHNALSGGPACTSNDLAVQRSKDPDTSSRVATSMPVMKVKMRQFLSTHEITMEQAMRHLGSASVCLCTVTEQYCSIRSSRIDIIHTIGASVLVCLYSTFCNQSMLCFYQHDYRPACSSSSLGRTCRSSVCSLPSLTITWPLMTDRSTQPRDGVQ